MPWTWLNKVVKNQSIFLLNRFCKRLVDSDSTSLFDLGKPLVKYLICRVQKK